LALLILQIGIDAVRKDEKITPSGETEELPLRLSVETPEACAVPVTKRADIERRGDRAIQERMRRESESEPDRAIVRRQVNSEGKAAADC